MVSGGTVSGDLSSIQSEFSSYSSATSGLSGSWSGPSFENFLSKTENFISEFTATIVGEMESFADACNLYKDYEQARKNLEICQSNISQAQAAEDSSGVRQWSAKASEYKDQMESLKPQIEAALVAASSSKLDAGSMTVSLDASGMSSNFSSSTGGAANGQNFWQVQQNGENCGMTAFLVGVNTLLGENIYTDNAGEWANYGGYSEAIGFGDNPQAQNWINDHGLSNKVTVTGIQNINSKEELYDHLSKGEVVVSSSGGDNIFKRNDGSYQYYDGHYILFYKTENGKCYANDSSVGDPSLAAGVEYTEEDLDRWFAAPGNHGSITMARKD